MKHLQVVVNERTFIQFGKIREFLFLNKLIKRNSNNATLKYIIENSIKQYDEITKQLSNKQP